MRMAMPVKVLVSAGNLADCTEACDLIDGIKAEKRIADRGYETNEIIETATKAGRRSFRPKRTEKQSGLMTQDFVTTRSRIKEGGSTT
jgi:hypothetical protein